MMILAGHKPALPFCCLWTAAFQDDTIGITDYNLRVMSVFHCSAISELNLIYNTISNVHWYR